MEWDRAYMHSGGARLFEMPGSDIRITGYLKKMKTMKKKFFVLRSTSSSGPARLEYYDTEKKYTSGQPPKRVIHLHRCFNINRKSDSRHKHAIALYTKEECFSVVCEDEEQLDRWLRLLLEYQNEFSQDCHGLRSSREHYDFVWQVSIQAKGLGQTMNIKGPYRLCLNSHSIYLFKLNMDKPHYVFQLETVRSVGHQDNVFKLVVGKFAPTGEGELFMHSDDAVVTQNIHETILDFMKNMDKRQDGLERRTFSESLHGSASSLPRPPPEFRNRSETFTQGSNRTRPRVDRPMSVCTRSARSTSHLQNAVSPGSSPHIHGFMEHHQIMGSHRLRSNSNESKASRASFSAVSDDPMHDHHSLVMRPALQEEPDVDSSFSLDYSPGFTSPGSLQLECDDLDGQEGERYMEINQDTATSPLSTSNTGYMAMAPCAPKGVTGVEGKEVWAGEQSCRVPMAPSSRLCSAPIPIHPIHSGHPGHPSHTGHGDHSYLDMTMHSVLPPVKEAGSAEGYVPMSPVANASSYGCDGSDIKPDLVKCMLADDGSDFSQPHMRTYSLGSRPQTMPGSGVRSTGYMNMSGGKKVSDNGRSCSAPHLVHPPQPHPHTHPHRVGSGRSSNVDSSTPTPSASPLSMSLRSDDSDAFMELDFYRPRTASDSYSYRPQPSSFGLQQPQGQGHRPRSSSHGQGTRPLHRQKMLAECMGRLNHEAVLRSHNASQNSMDSLKVSSSESLKKLSQEVRTKTAQLNTSSGYMDMSGSDRRLTPSPQPGSTPSSHQSEHEGYVDMTLGKHEDYVDMTVGSHRSATGFKQPSTKTVSDSPNSSFFGGAYSSSGLGQDCVYINVDSVDSVGKKESSPHSSPSETTEAYIMYEPAVTLSSSSPAGKENFPSTNTSIPKDRPSSAKEGKKRGGFFSLRHGDSGKQASKKSDSTQMDGVVHATTGGQQFGSLGRDFRKKSKDLNKAARQKSSSFSKTFGITTSKPGKPLRKSPTPPSSLDGNDEYIEFLPTATKSDSDSSHSSGCVKASVRPEAVPQDDAAYVGFEPGNIPPSSHSYNQQIRAIPDTSNYLPMNPGSGANQPKVFSDIQPTKKSTVIKQSKSREESNPVVCTAQRMSEFGRVVDSCMSNSTPCGCAQSASRDGQSSAVRPQYCDSTQPTVCRVGDSGYGYLPPPPTLPVLPVGRDAMFPTTSMNSTMSSESQVCVQSTTQSVPQASSTTTTMHGPNWSVLQHQSIPQPSIPHCESSSCCCAVSSTSSAPLSSTCAPNSSTHTPNSSSCAVNSSAASCTSQSIWAAPVQSDAQCGGYMLFDPAQSAGTAAAVCEVTPAVVACRITSTTTATEAAQTTATLPSSAPSSDPSHLQQSSSVISSSSTSSLSALPSGRKGSGRRRRKSGGKTSSGKAIRASSCEQSSTEKQSGEQKQSCAEKQSGVEKQSSADKQGGADKQSGVDIQSGNAKQSGADKQSGVDIQSGNAKQSIVEKQNYAEKQSGVEKQSGADKQSGVEKQSGAEKGCGVVGSGLLSDPIIQSDEGCPGHCEAGTVSSKVPGLLRLDSMPSMGGAVVSAGSSAGMGRGRHNSSSSIGVATGRMAGEFPEGDPKSINSGTDTRHSISDLIGWQQMTFPSNALSRQQAPPPPPHSPTSTSSQGTLNYAQLDLSSTDSLGGEGAEGVRSPRNRSRHSSAADEKAQLSYATIDFEKPKEGLLNSAAGKDMKLIV